MQTRKDLHARHAREREAMQGQIETLQKASAVASFPDALKRQALLEVSRLKQENDALQERLRAVEAPPGTAEAVSELQVPLHCSVACLCCCCRWVRLVWICHGRGILLRQL